MFNHCSCGKCKPVRSMEERVAYLERLCAHLVLVSGALILLTFLVFTIKFF